VHDALADAVVAAGEEAVEREEELAVRPAPDGVPPEGAGLRTGR